MALIGADGPVGQCQPPTQAPTDHGLDEVAEKPTCGSAVAQFARAFEVFPGNLERFLKQLGKRDRHDSAVLITGHCYTQSQDPAACRNYFMRVAFQFIYRITNQHGLMFQQFPAKQS
jgi:hypothetical protein